MKDVWTINPDGLTLCKNGKEMMALGRITPMSSKETAALAKQIADAMNAAKA